VFPDLPVFRAVAWNKSEPFCLCVTLSEFTPLRLPSFISPRELARVKHADSNLQKARDTSTLFAKSSA